MDFKTQADQDAAEMSGKQQDNNSWMKFQEGDNRLRILAEPIKIVEKYNVGICYEGCGYAGTVKYLTWVINRADGDIKLLRLPYTVGQQVRALMDDPDYTFEKFPMPYDINVKAKKAGTKEVEYSLIPAKAEKALTTEEENAFLDKKDVEEIIESMKRKQQERVESGEVKVPVEDVEDEYGRTAPVEG